MPRLYRPHIPMSVRITVARRQLVERGMPVGDVPAKPLFAALGMLQKRLALAMGCESRDLRLDHDPPLAARPKLQYSGVIKPTFFPAANDPDHLFYRPHGPEHENSHLIKTNVRGDHGQHPDRVLIKKARRFERALAESEATTFVYQNPKIKAQIAPGKMPKRKWASRPFPTTKGKSRWKT